MNRNASIVLLLLTFAVACGAETRLDLEKAVDLAVQRNLNLVNKKIDTEALKRSADTAWSSLVPSLSAGAGASSSNESLADGSWTVYGSAGASFSLSASVFTDIQKARLNYEAGLITYDTARRSLELSVRKAFYALLLAGENIKLQEQTLESARSQYEITAASYRNGRSSELDLLTAQVAVETAKPDLESSRIEYVTKMGTFKTLLGISLDDTVALEGSLDTSLTSAALDVATPAGENATLVALRKSLELAKVNRTAAIGSAYVPTLGLSWTWKPTWYSSNGENSDNGTVSATVSFSLDNLFPWSSAALGIKSTDDSITKLENQIADETLTSKLTITNLVDSLRQSLSLLDLRKLSASLAERKLTLTQEAYNKGTKDLSSLQDARDSLAEARLAVLTQSYNLMSSLLDLEDELGVPFGSLGGKK